MRAVYLDTSAALKQVRREEFTDELVSYLVGCAGEEIAITSSTLLDVELARFAVREGLDHEGRIAPVLAPVARRQLSRRVVKDASEIAVHIRSLDAIHIATAAALGDDLVAVVTYDKQMVRAAEHLGVPVVSPGEPQ
ncbi:type II toxin-antitoxin system VapC family toxin [Antribacter sp. KLBMP9083]|uniref:Type II toxin-antitoxin system VapC family toxin n=1 Tax=Antribacter soli TaxID=2910976 RepID=A0AA41U8X8_9MICO|nr:type II toxin-antitoxin system VapC family toxin [Antribacter soli]MCF4122925.1 type II toxin-antitoxin system VapC family toxin [Antribacter soli]